MLNILKLIFLKLKAIVFYKLTFKRYMGHLDSSVS